MRKIEVPPDHPRAESLRMRERLITKFKEGIVAYSGLIAHGRGEAFDYLMGEKTSKAALEAITAASALLLTATNPVISVNGNTAALAAEETVTLAQITHSKIEVNLFYRSKQREVAIAKLLEKAGAKEVLGIGKNASAKIPELSSERRRVDPNGILTADVVLVPLEDGDRTEALIKMGKKVITVDLNPLSRTAQAATITIVDNIVRVIPKLIETVERTKKLPHKKQEELVGRFDNGKNLAKSLITIRKNLEKRANDTAVSSSNRRAN
jgi:4-phosphopantoate--beta-alanine ligase